MSRSVLFHVQYLLGIGHLQRSLRIANALARDGIDVTLVCGGPPITELPADPSIKFVQLAPVRARDARFELIDGAGRPLDDALREKRRADLLAAFAAARPDAVIIEGFPFARRAEPRHAPFITLLMSTGLTFGTISSLYGLNAGIIDSTQFSLLVTVVVLSAIVPTAIAQWRYSPLGDLDRHTDPLPAEEYV